MKTNTRALEMVKLASQMSDVENTHDQCLHCWEVNCGCETKVSVQDDLFLNFQDEFQIVELSNAI